MKKGLESICEQADHFYDGILTHYQQRVKAKKLVSLSKYLVFTIVLAMIFLLSFPTDAVSIYCSVGESITVEKEDNETIWLDEEYLIQQQDGSFLAIKEGTTEIIFSHTEIAELPTQEQETTEPDTTEPVTSEPETNDDASETTVATETTKEDEATKEDIDDVIISGNEGDTKEVVVERVVTVIISGEAKEIKLNKTKITLGKGESFSLSYALTPKTAHSNVCFRSVNSKIASVNENGKITAKSTGSTTIIAETSNGIIAKCAVTVKKAPKTIKLNEKALELGVDETYTLKATCDKDSASYAKTFTSSNPKVLKVKSNGTLTALKKGKATVTVETFNGKTATCTVTVKAAPKSISLSVSSLKLGKGEKYKFTVSLPKNSASEALKFSTSNEKLGTVSSSGVLTACGTGKFRITVTTYNGMKASCAVNVMKAPTKISTGATSYTVYQGKRFSPSFNFGNGEYSNSITYSSSANTVSTLNGKVWAKKMGTARVTATTYNGKSCTFSVTVKAMKVPYVTQLPSYPTGCEAASCTALLRYYGYSITLEQMINTIPRENVVTKNGKRYGPSIYEKFVGNPRNYYNSSSPGYGAFSPCVTKALQKAINARNGKHKATLLTGCEWNDVLKEISLGRPAIVWATYRMLVPSNVNSWYARGSDGKYRYFEYPKGTHVTVLTGYSDGYVTIMDPIDGTVSYNINTFEKRWHLLGNQAIVLK